MMTFLPPLESRALSTPLQMILPHALLFAYLAFPPISQFLSKVPLGKITFGLILLCAHSVNFHVFTTTGGGPSADFGSASSSWYHAAKGWTLVVIEDPHKNYRKIRNGGEKEVVSENQVSKRDGEDSSEKEIEVKGGFEPTKSHLRKRGNLDQDQRLSANSELDHDQSKRKDGDSEDSRDFQDLTFRERVNWSLGLIITMRGFNWNYGETHLQRFKKHSGVKLNPFGNHQRWSWLGWETKKLLFEILLMDIVNAYMQSRPSFKPLWLTKSVGNGTLPPASLHSSPFPFKILDISSAAAISYLSLSTIYKALSIVTVLLRLSKPGDWYPLFGNVKNCTSLRNFWDGSHFWHGLHRDTLVRISKSLINCLPLDRETKQPSTRQRSTSNSKLYDFLLLVSVFSLSTSLHVVGTFAMNRSWKGSVKFFLIQIVGLSLEEQVGRIVGAGLNDRNKKVLGYFWVAFWFYMTSPFFFNDLIDCGFWEIDMLPYPFSPVRLLLRHIHPQKS